MKTKEELVKEVARLTQTNSEWSSADETRRKNLSKMLDAPTKSSYGTSERITYSWPEIYFELGKISTRLDLSGIWMVVRQSEDRLQKIERDLFEENEA